MLHLLCSAEVSVIVFTLGFLRDAILGLELELGHVNNQPV